jgi:serine phosphatase RsbU (regulator of sigma subunit)
MSTDKNNMFSTDWPEASQFKKSIRLEFALYVSGIIFALMLVTGYIISSQYVKTVTQSVVEKLLVQARSYSGPAGKLIISSGGPDALLLNNICRKLVNDDPDVHWAGITDERDVFLAHSNIRRVIGSTKMRPVAANQFQDILRPMEGFSLEGDTVYISVSIEENGVTLGKLAVAASASSIKTARNTSVVTVASITIVMIAIGIPITVTVLRRKLKPIGVITDHLKAVDFHDVSLDIPIRSENEFGFLAETIRVMGSKLNVAQRDLIEKERMTRELEIAREIQANILPKVYPRGLRFALAGTYRSAMEVGGDYYDFIEFDDGRLGVLVADVSGKSLPGMLVMLITRDIVHRLARQVQEPARLLTDVNSELLKNIKKGMFVTMFFGVLDVENGRFRFASAGHNPLVVLRGDTGTVELVKTKGFPLGMVSSPMYETRVEGGEIRLSENDWLIQYTDGVNEAQNAAGDEFGTERLTELVEKHRHLNPEEFVKAILSAHQAFVGDAAQYDDITLLAVKWGEQSADKRIRRVGETANAG